MASGGYKTVSGAVDDGTTDDVEDMERTILVKQEACVYKIPSGGAGGDEQSGWKATGWNLDKPEWKGRLRLVSKGARCILKLEDAKKCYAKVEVDAYPGPGIQSVTDSSRYFVIRTDAMGHMGLGFGDRSDSFDLNVALQDHFKSLRVEAEIRQETEEPREKLDLAFKEGQTIKVNINIPRKRDRSRSPAAAGHGRATAAAIPAPTAEMIAAGIVPPPPKDTTTCLDGGQGQGGLPPPRLSAPPVPQANPNWIQF